MSLRTTQSPTVPGGRAASYELCSNCLHIVLVIGKYIDVFRGIFLMGGGGGQVTWEDLSMVEIFHERGTGFPSIHLEYDQKLN